MEGICQDIHGLQHEIGSSFLSLLIHLVVDYNTLSLLLLLKRSSLKYVKSISISIPLVHETELLDNWKKKKRSEELVELSSPHMSFNNKGDVYRSNTTWLIQ